MKGYLLSKSIILFAICLLAEANALSSNAQATGNQSLILKIVSNRQKVFKKTKNPKISCDELKNQFLKTFISSDKSLEGIDPLTEAQIRKYLKCPQTEWESVLERSAVELYKEQINAGISKLAIPMPKNLVWAPNLCPCYNASANYLGNKIPSLKDNWLIEINSSLDINTGEYAKVAALATPIVVEDNLIAIDTKLDSYTDRLSKNPDIFKMFMMRLLAHLVNDPALEEQSIHIGQPYLPLYSMYSQYAQIFALSHELSHVLLSHQAIQQGLVVSDSNKKDIKLSYTSFADGVPKELAYKQEYAADSLGLEIMLAVADANYSNSSDGMVSDIKIKLFGIYGAEMLLTWMEMFQNAEIVTYGKYEGAESHPAASNRRDRIRRILQKKGLIKDNSDFGLSTYRAMNLMWSKFKPLLTGDMAQRIKAVKKTAKCRSND